MEQAKDLLRGLPSVDRLLQHPECVSLLKSFSREFVTRKCREVLDDLRRELRKGQPVPPAELQEGAIAGLVRQAVDRDGILKLRRVVNATGTILHTNLGRALLPREALDAISLAGREPVNLEYDLAEGRRGKREEGIEELLRELTEAEAATVVNNNAAAVLLGLNTLAEGKEVIVSRGELIEIGGSFRIPEIMAKSGAILKEVGTTNRTHPEDYEKAINKNTALLLKVHTSNYRIVGFSSEANLSQLVRLGREHEIPVMEDLGSGALIDLSQYGLPKEPVVRERVALGADLITFSGDKILGGPQAGLLVGRKVRLDRVNKNPLKRALRCGKITLAALEATLRLYQRSPHVAASIPTLKLFTRSPKEIEEFGRKILPDLQERLGPEFHLAIEDCTSQIGSGALPTEEIPSKAIVVHHRKFGPDRIARIFRSADPPILGRIKDNRFLLDLRGIFDPGDLIPRFEEEIA